MEDVELFSGIELYEMGPKLILVELQAVSTFWVSNYDQKPTTV